MSVNTHSSQSGSRRRLQRSLIAAAVSAFAGAAFADADATAAAPQETVTEELIRMLAAHNALSADDAAKLLNRLQAQKAAPAAPTAAAAAAAAPVDATAANLADKGKVRVIYVPESEKQKIRDEVKAEVIAQAKAENWAQPNAIPEWTKHITIEGDLRYRQEGDFYDQSNDPNQINFQAINSGAPVNVNFASTTPVVLPYLNTQSDRQLPRFRARLGLVAQISEDLTTSFRFNSGNNTNPVSTDQTLGTDFNKTTFVIDRAYFDYHPSKNLSVWAGRAPNPFESTDLLFDRDLNFDGVSTQLRHSFADNLRGRLTLGAFSIENTAYDFPSTSSQKGSGRDKWLFSAQLGLDWKLQPGMTVSGSVAYHDYYELDGKARPCDPNPLSASIACSADDGRPGFIQKGNTLFALRQLTPAQPTDPQFQYFGLASPFRILDTLVTLDRTIDGPVHARIDLDYVRNLGYHRKAVVDKGPVNNFGGCATSDPSCTASFAGGGNAFMVQARFGYGETVARWQWNAFGGYKRLDSDAVVDAFTDSDFHYGGTNAKGYFIGGNLGLAHNTWFTARYLSASEVSGPPLSIDVLQFDLNARF